MSKKKSKGEKSMLGNFSYVNTTKLYFGDDSLKFLNEELPKYGKTVQLIFGVLLFIYKCMYFLFMYLFMSFV